jgi:hypothetical protein
LTFFCFLYINYFMNMNINNQQTTEKKGRNRNLLRDLISKVFQLVTCRFGNHKWELLMSIGLCGTQYVCNRCKAVKNGPDNHDYVWKNLLDKKCEQREVCSRCDIPSGNVRENHQWKEWEYLSDHSCEQHQFCSRCGFESFDTRTVHKWEDWKYIGGCKEQRVCQRCQESEKQDSHDFSVFKSSSVVLNQVTNYWVCSRDGCDEIYVQCDPGGHVSG